MRKYRQIERCLWCQKIIRFWTKTCCKMWMSRCVGDQKNLLNFIEILSCRLFGSILVQIDGCCELCSGKSNVVQGLWKSGFLRVTESGSFTGLTDFGRIIKAFALPLKDLKSPRFSEFLVHSVNCFSGKFLFKSLFLTDSVKPSTDPDQGKKNLRWNTWKKVVIVEANTKGTVRFSHLYRTVLEKREYQTPRMKQTKSWKFTELLLPF